MSNMRRSSRLEAVSDHKARKRIQMRAKLLDPRIKTHESRFIDLSFSSGSSESDETARRNANHYSMSENTKGEAKALNRKRKVTEPLLSNSIQGIELQNCTDNVKPKSILKRSKANASEPLMANACTASVGENKKFKNNDAKQYHRRPTHQRPNRSQVIKSEKPALHINRSQKFQKTYQSHPVTQFYHEVLDWDFYSALRKENQKVSDSHETVDGSQVGETDIYKVPSQFDTYDHYFSVWKPLAIQEAQAQAVNTVLSDYSAPITVKLSSVSQENVSIHTSCKLRVEYIKEKALGNSRRDVLDPYHTNDLVLLTPCKSYFEAFQRNSAAKYARARGKEPEASNGSKSVEANNEPTGVLAVVTSQNSTREGLTLTALASHYNLIRDEPSVFLFKVHNLTTSIREYRALCDCKYYELMPLLLSGKHEDGSMRLDSLGLEYVRWLKRSFNDSQLEAITASATSQGFTLIKGPPGTGKTTTLKGLLNSLHLREYNRYYNAVLDVARRPDRETSKAWAAVNNEKPHILVAAPSNAAVDNIVGKIMEEGFCDGEGRRYFPQIVRVGRGLSANVRSVGLDDMVDQICSQSLDVLETRILQLRRDLAIVERDSGFIREELRQIVAAINLNPEAHIQSTAPTTSATVPQPRIVSKSTGDRDCHTEQVINGAAIIERDKDAIETTTKSTTTSDDQEMEEEDENDEPFPPSFPSLLSEDIQFNHDETAYAFNELMGGGNSSAEEDEPLPVANSIKVCVAPSNATEDDVDEPFPAVKCEALVESSAQKIESASTNLEESCTTMTEQEPSKHAPPALPPPVLASSPPSAISMELDKAKNQNIDYTHCDQYRNVAQRINCCLERRGALLLELQRYEFARKAVVESGKPSQAMRHSLEVSFLETAHIVFTTLSSAGVAALDASSRYDVLVIDEAAQAVELSTIIPMKFGSRQCVLVGDPQQLSATTFSRTSVQSLYERSLFERLESCGHPVHMLRTQYRSHPMISEFPRHYFYGGKLQDGATVQLPTYTKCYHQLFGPAFQPLVFWNLVHSRDSVRSVSRLNMGEAELAVNLYLTLKHSCPPDAIAGKVGIITPYSQQMEELRSRFRQRLGDRYDAEVEINTVDGFQGREKDIIILSTVRGDPRAGIGFLNDIRRMNVALTRAKFACYVLGNESTLRSSRPWAAFIKFVYEKRCIVHVADPACNLTILRPMARSNEEEHNELVDRREGVPKVPPQLFTSIGDHGWEMQNSTTANKNSKRTNQGHGPNVVSNIQGRVKMANKQNLSQNTKQTPYRAMGNSEKAKTRPVPDQNCLPPAAASIPRSVSSRDPRRSTQFPVTS